MNRELKAAIIRKFGAQFPFAAALGIREATVSAVVRGHQVLDETNQKKWATALGVADYHKLFQGAGNGKK